MEQQELAEALQQLASTIISPNSTPLSPSVPKIVVVGNGGSVIDNLYGHIIDQADEIVRFNFPELIQDYSGVKTTTMVLNHEWDSKKFVIPSGAQVMRITSPNRRRAYGNTTATLPRQISTFRTGWPSSGACVINALVTQKVRFKMVGLDGYNPEGLRRYWEEEPCKKDYHDRGEEARLIEEALKSGYATLLSDDPEW